MSNAYIKIEEVDKKKREITVSCYLNKNKPEIGSINVVAWYDYERQLGLSHVLTKNGEHIFDHLDFNFNLVLLSYCQHLFHIKEFLEDFLLNTDTEPGRIFTSPRPIDWDTIAKEDKLMREQER
jgi:hypothetical protein